MSVLDFSKPPKARPTAAHNAAYQSDSGVAGTYVPNMSAADRLKWKAKRIKGKDPRIEIRKTVWGSDPSLRYPLCSSQILLVVRPNGSVIMSGNGRMAFNANVWRELGEAVTEGRNLVGCGNCGWCLDCLRVERAAARG